MSRCFPYPPPGYEKIGISHEALIESIKRGEKTKKERKEKRRERKKEEKKQRNGELEKNKHGHKKRHKRERSQDDQKGQEHRKRRKHETEQFEKSSLTEEHGHPVNAENLCNSSDSTLNSESRQKQSSPSNGGHNNGSIVRIRLAANRHKDVGVLPCKEQPYSVLGSSDASLQKENESALRGGASSTSTIASQNHNFKLSGEKSRSSSRTFEILSQKAQTALSPSNVVSPLELKFRELIENFPPISQTESIDLDDQEWLFPTKQSRNFGAERFKAGSDALTCEFSTPCHGICYFLPEADIYALPFTVPY